MFATSLTSVIHSSPAGSRSWPRRRLSGTALWLWHWLRRPWLAVIACLLGVILVLAAWQLPQLPGQLADEQAAAATWLLNTSAAYGIWGNAFLALGLFDVLHSPLVYLLLALLLPTLAAQLADHLGAIRQQQRLHQLDLAAPALAPGEALEIPTERPLFRWRGLMAAEPVQVSETLTAALQRSLGGALRVDAPIALPDPTSAQETPEIPESRWVAMQNPRLHYLRPLLMFGLLLCITGAWIALAFGWQVTAPPLAPGATFRSANRNLALQYQVNTANALENTLETMLAVTLQGANALLPTTEGSRQRIGPATLQVRPQYPGIWIATADGSEALTLPGETKQRSQVGLVFAAAGSEESVLLPEQAAGLRIVQRSGSEGFVLELYRSDEIRPVYRAELTAGGQLTIPLAPDDLELVISSLPGLQANVRHLPGLWLVPLGFLLALVGAAAFMRPSAFVLAQAAPWDNGRTVVVLQSDDPEMIASVRAVLRDVGSNSALIEAAESGNEATLAGLRDAG